MGTIFSGTGLISGLDITSIVDKLIAIEARPRDLLTQRASNIDAQRTAFLDISARISGILSRLAALNRRSAFVASSAISSNPSAIGVTVGDNAVPGSYQFRVRSLASSQQLVSRGFASTTAAIPSGTITLESARARVNTDTQLDSLNGYAGVQRGSIQLTDASGTERTVNLSDATTLSDVVDRINAVGLNIQARVRDDHLELRETTGGTIRIAEVDDGRTAADLGFGAGHTYSTTGGLTGTDLLRLSESTPISALNDGTGIRTQRAGGDFSINGMTVDLSGLMTPNTRLARLNHGSGVSLGSFRITTYDASGVATQHNVDLSSANTIGDAKSVIEGSAPGVTVTVTGDKLIVGYSGNATSRRLTIEDVNGGSTASDLGITGDSATGRINGRDSLTNDTVADVLAAINYADASDGSVHASLDGMGIHIDAGASAVIAAINDAPALDDLGLPKGTFNAPVTGSRLLGGIDSVLLRTLNGGQGINAGQVYLEAGGQSTTVDLTGVETLQGAVDRINDAFSTANIAAEVSYDSTGTRLVASSHDGVTPLRIADLTGNFALTAGIQETGATIRGANLQRQYVNEATRLTALNNGRGVSAGTFRITNAAGVSATIDLSDASSKSLQDVITRINDSNIGVTARVNDTGDGLLLTDGSTGPGALAVADQTGTAARDLNLTGASTGGAIDGSYEIRINTGNGLTLQGLVDRINQSGATPAAASILNDGTSVSPYRLQLNARASGRAGEFVLDGGTTGIDFTTLSRAQDAQVILGSGVGGVVVSSSSNTLTNVVPGLTLNLTGTSDDPVTVTVNEDSSTAKQAISDLVDAFNDSISRVRDASGYDADTDTRGILLGDSTADAIENRLVRYFTGVIPGATGAITRFSQLGITIRNGNLQFDETKFDAALAQNPEAVISLFTDATSGLATTLKTRLEAITDSSTGLIGKKSKSLESQKKDLTDRIDTLNELLDRKRERLMTQYQAMESALAQMQSQQSALGQISSLGQH